MPSHTDSRRSSGMSSVVSFRLHPLALACAGLALAASFGAAAQDHAPSATALDTITVTAEHREQNLQEVPVSVGVVQGERMRDFTAGGDDRSEEGRVGEAGRSRWSPAH